MNRLTHERSNGIKTGYWSPEKKEELVQRLAAYENTGLEPKKIQQIDQLYQELSKEVMQFRKDLARMPDEKWISIEEQLPETEDYILLSFANFSLPMVGRYEKSREGGAFYLGDCDEEDTCINQELVVNAWRPLPKPYLPKGSEAKAEVIPPAPASWRHHMERRFNRKE